MGPKMFTIMMIAICVIFIGGMVVLIASDMNEPIPPSYTQTSQNEFNTLKSPVVLIGKDKQMGAWGITVRDSTGRVLTIGNLSTLANHIGASRNIGDTLK